MEPQQCTKFISRSYPLSIGELTLTSGFFGSCLYFQLPQTIRLVDPDFIHSNRLYIKHAYNVRAPKYLSWCITPITMFYGTYNYSYWGL